MINRNLFTSHSLDVKFMSAGPPSDFSHNVNNFARRIGRQFKTFPIPTAITFREKFRIVYYERYFQMLVLLADRRNNKKTFDVSDVWLCIRYSRKCVIVIFML